MRREEYYNYANVNQENNIIIYSGTYCGQASKSHLDYNIEKCTCNYRAISLIISTMLTINIMLLIL